MARLQRFLTKIYVALIASHLPPTHHHQHPPLPGANLSNSRLEYGRNMPILKSASGRNSTRSGGTAPTARFQGVFRRGFQSLSRHLLETNSSDHIKPLARLLAHQARAQVSTWALSLKGSSLCLQFPEVNLRVFLNSYLKLEINRKVFNE